MINFFLGKISNSDVYRRIIHDNSGGVFLDIETTGLKRDRDPVYLIGIMYPEAFDNDLRFKITLFFAENTSEEKDILTSFSSFLNDYGRSSGRVLKFITFNGDRFDIPFLKTRYLINNIPCPGVLTDTEHTDIYKMIKPFRKYFGLSHLNQKSIEKLLMINREDKYTGGELIDVYREYASTGDPGLLDMLITHNKDDVYGMYKILPVLNYSYVFTKAAECADDISKNDAFSVLSYVEDTFMDHNGQESVEFKIEFTLPCSVPCPHLFHNDRIFLSLNKDTGVLRLPVLHGELRHYFSNYKDYYYIPSEDKAILKTLGDLMDPSLYEKAKADTCYVRFSGAFLPLPGEADSFTIYKNQRKDRICYARIEDIKNTPDLREYLIKIISYAFS